MTLHPQVQAVLDARAADAEISDLGGEPTDGIDARSARAALLAKARAEHDEATPFLSGAPEDVGAVEQRAIPTAAGDLPVRIYRPLGEEVVGVTVFLHGGGWIMGSAASHEPLARALANASRSTVVNVEYRLAPEDPFPAAVEDAEAALRWCREHGGELCGEPGRVAVAGDSAGGNLAAVIARRSRDRGETALRLQLLIYPATDSAMDSESYEHNGSGYGLTRGEMELCWRLYLDGSDGSSSDASPLRADDLRGLAPALVITAEHDPLRDEGERYAERLAQAGVPVRSVRYDGMSHGFVRWLAQVDDARHAVTEAGRALHQALSA